MNPFYFSTGSILFFTGNLLALLGLVITVLIFSLVFATPEVRPGWIGAAVALPASSLAALLFAAQRVYSRLRGNIGWLADENVSLRRHLSACFEKRSHRRLSRFGDCRDPALRSLLLGSGSVQTKVLGNCCWRAPWRWRWPRALLASYVHFLLEVKLGRYGMKLAPGTSAMQLLMGSVVGGIITGIVIAPLVTLYFGSIPDRPMLTPDYLLPGSVLGASFIVFSIINFDFERLNSRRVWTSACSSILAVMGGAIAAGITFGPLYVIGLVDAVQSWLHDNSENTVDLLAGGALYGIPVGLVLGLVIGIAVICTERWSRRPVLV